MSQHDAPGAAQHGDVPTASPWASDESTTAYVPPAGSRPFTPLHPTGPQSAATQPGPMMPSAASPAATGRSRLGWVVIGIAGFGLAIAVISMALPWEHHAKEGRYGFAYYYGVTESGGYSYTFLLAALVLTVVALQFVPPRWNAPLRISGAVVALLLIGMVSGIAVTAMLGANENHSPVTIGWGLLLAYAALPALGLAAALSPPRTTSAQPYPGQAQG